MHATTIAPYHVTRAVLFSLVLLPLLACRELRASEYQFTALTADIPGISEFQDNNLLFTWGVALDSQGRLWVSNQGTGVVSVYTIQGARAPADTPLVITVPASAAEGPGALGAPMGLLLNTSNDFIVTSGGVSAPSTLIVATGDGTLCGWNPAVDAANAIRVVDTLAAARYESIAFSSNTSGNFLLAANFPARRIDVFDGNFQPAGLTGSFTDPDLPADFSPLSVHNIGGNVYVCYAQQSATDPFAEVPGAGNGIISVFNTDGQFVRRLVSNGVLNSPLGMALAPQGFGAFSGALIVGNCNDGLLNAFDPATGTLLGALTTSRDNDLRFAGVRGLAFGTSGETNATTLFVVGGVSTSGSRGLIGSIVPLADAPTFASAPSATPANPVAGQLVTFSAAAGNAGASPAYIWDFGDGEQDAGATSTHTYAAAGFYLAQVRAINGSRLTSAALPLTVGASQALVIQKMKLSLDLSRNGNDTLQMSGTVALPAGFTPAGQQVSLSLSGVTRTFQLDAKGSSPKGTQVLQLRAGKTGASKFTVKLGATDLSGLRTTLGLADQTVKGKPVVIQVMLQVGDTAFVNAYTQLYDAVQGAKGTTRSMRRK